jgi:hypothetical protein
MKHPKSRLTIIALVAAALALAVTTSGCESLTGVRPPSVGCQDTIPATYDSVSHTYKFTIKMACAK